MAERAKRKPKRPPKTAPLLPEHKARGDVTPPSKRKAVKTAPPIPASEPNSGSPVRSIANNTIFRVAYAAIAVLVLFATTLLWSILGSHVQAHNSDQLSDPYLFSTWATFHGAFFPGSHTFLLKWPIFWLISVFGVTARNIDIATVGVVMATIATLVVVLYKIDRRPLVFGTICLSLSLALLLVPAQPYAGALLPANMAMLTTRNIEYAIYLVVLILFARAKHMKDWGFIGGVVLLSVLVASDKLFLSLSLGGALIALFVYATMRAWNLVTFAVHWVFGSALAALGSIALLAAISASHLTHFVSSNSADPYSLVSGAQNVALGVIYSILGLFTNAGANPVYDNLIVRKLPSELMHKLMSFSDPAYLAAAIALIYALLLAWRIAWRDPRSKPKANPSVAVLLALALIWSTAAAFVVYIGTNHYYEVDARYLTIGLFALVISTSVELRKRRWQHPESLLYVACGLIAAIAIAVGTSVNISNGQSSALNNLINRNHLVAAALKSHKVDVLVGSYWRVLPIKLAMNGNITAMPLSNCTQPYNVLTSSQWQPNLSKHSFAYLLTLRGNSVAGFPDCSIATVSAAYGRPNATQVIAGSIANPSEVLLFFDRGSSKPSTSAKETSAPVSVFPITMGDLSADDDYCTTPTVMNIVAHEDDDLLFLSPDLIHEIKTGDCVRTIYLTAGNAGQGRLYWLGRQLGSEAAYSEMLGIKSVWEQQTVEIAKGEYVTVANPSGDTKDTLIFFNLPDGNLQGQGYPMSNYESLMKLERGSIHTMETVDNQSSYTSTQLVSALEQMMQLYRPSVIQTQANVPGGRFPDHSDHIYTGIFAQDAATAYDQQEFGGAVTIPVKLYVGYPIHGYPANVSGPDLQLKENAFLAYAAFDDSVCHSIAQCQSTPTYNAYLTHEYLSTTPVLSVSSVSASKVH